MLGPLQLRNESFRKHVASLEKRHLRETKKMKDSIKKEKEEISRLRKKVQKDSSASLTNLLEQSTRQLYSQYMELSDKEQEAVRMISQQKRLHLCAVISYIKPVVEEEVKIFRKAELMSDILNVIDKVIRESEMIQTIYKTTNMKPWGRASLRKLRKTILLEPQYNHAGDQGWVQGQDP